MSALARTSDQAARLRSLVNAREPQAVQTIIAVIAGAAGAPTWALAECFRGTWCDQGMPASVVDCGHGEDAILRAVHAKPTACVVIATPDLAGMTGAYAVIKALALGILPAGDGVSPSPAPPVRHFTLIPSCCNSSAQALDIWSRVCRTAAAFLQVEPAWAGWLPDGPAWEEATVDMAHRLRAGLGKPPAPAPSARMNDRNCATW